MWYGLLMTGFVVLCVFLGLFILIQQGKGDMGLGSIGGGSQTLFGGSGGQDFFEKSTWVMGLIFVGFALLLTIWQPSQTQIGTLYKKEVPAQPADSTTQEQPLQATDPADQQ